MFSITHCEPIQNIVVIYPVYKTKNNRYIENASTSNGQAYWISISRVQDRMNAAAVRLLAPAALLFKPAALISFSLELEMGSPVVYWEWRVTASLFGLEK